ncbi:glycosyltransferase [Aestuariivivens marinum]|uniref:glycosyltransferase n=1 Tax=Aestuariivivens marinum TaxID=2913555 RepID=UPI001F585BEF|nr:glycosyltransferase [Aestuariivivens marinum]
MLKRVKILYTIPNFDTAGSGKVVYDLVKGLDKTLFAPEIACFHKEGDFFKVVEQLDVPIHQFTFAQPYRPFWSLPHRIYKISRFFKQHQFDIIHSWHWSSDFSEPLAAKWAGIPYVYTKKAMGWGNKAWRWRTQLSTKIIAINTDMVAQFFKGMHHKVVHIPLGVDIDYFKPQQPTQALKQSLDILDTDFVIVTVANLVPVKGIETLMEAAKALNDTAIKVLVIGRDDNAYASTLKQRYSSENCLFLGLQPDVRPYLALADLFVIPTRNEGRKEGFPIAPIEAMAAGCLVLGSNISGINDILKAFPKYLFEPSNIDELAKKIKYIKDTPSIERKLTSKAMRDYVEKNFDIKQCVLNHELLYNTI